MNEKWKVQRMWVSALVLALLTIMAGVAGGSEHPPNQPHAREVLLGGLFSLTGNWATLGQTSAVAVEIAVDEVNRYLEGNAAGLRFRVAVVDTRLEPERALEEVRALHALGAQILIGPQSSAEVAYLKPYVDANGLLLVSHGSTAGNLAIPDDNVFRFTPSDVPEGVANSAMMWEDGIRTIVPVWRDDAGNAGLEAATRAAFSKLGGTALEGVSYDTATENFTATAAALRGQVERAIVAEGADHVAVYLAAFDEVVQLFATAAMDPVLGTVRWYGSNGVALSDALVSDPKAAAFAIRTGYPNPVFGRDEGCKRDLGAAGRADPRPHRARAGRIRARCLRCGLGGGARLHRFGRDAGHRTAEAGLHHGCGHALRRNRVGRAERSGRPPLRRLRFLGDPDGGRRAALDPSRRVRGPHWKADPLKACRTADAPHRNHKGRPRPSHGRYCPACS
jgi:ABC-type branched-subunit amino acid transport system substrate-binding protein